MRCKPDASQEKAAKQLASMTRNPPSSSLAAFEDPAPADLSQPEVDRIAPPPAALLTKTQE